AKIAVMEVSTPLHSQRLMRRVALNRAFALAYACAILALLYHHAITLLCSTNLISFSLYMSMLVADVLLAFMWATTQSFRMLPAVRQVYPENLEKVVKREDFPSLDIFICTADPHKEPPMNVVNTALSVMAYDYPTEKLSVYVSDDGGSELTLFAFMEAAKFASHWLPYCRDHEILKRCPDAYFSSNYLRCSEVEKIKLNMALDLSGQDFAAASLTRALTYLDSQFLESLNQGHGIVMRLHYLALISRMEAGHAGRPPTMYESMKVRVENVVERGMASDEYITSEEERQAFNKWTRGFTRQDHPTVIQVLLDKGKDRDNAGHAMPNLIYVSRQKSRTSPHHFKAGALNALFPQRFHALNKADIYACEFKRLFQINPAGMDGLAGPNYVGTGCFFSRRALFGGPSSLVPPEIPELGPSHITKKPITAQEVMTLAHQVAGCNYENQTNWGSKMGFRYGSLVEDYYTGYRLQCEGWESVFCHPGTPAFLGDVPISLNDVLNQTKRWSVGLLEVAFSKYSPLTFGFRSMGPIMGLCYAHYAFWPILAIPITIYAFLPQMALLSGVSIFPKRLMRRVAVNRAFALAYACAILALLYYHALALLHSTTLISFSMSISMLVADVLLAFMWASSQSFRMRPAVRQVYPENLEKVVKREDFPSLDIFICTADPYKEPPMNVVNTALSVMAYDYPTEKLSVYVSDDGGSELALFAFMEAAKFASHWLPYCRDREILKKCPHAYFSSNYLRCSETEKIKTMYESMKMRVENVVEKGKFPQRFHGLNKADIYACEFKQWFQINSLGMDGLAGPIYAGTGCFFSRRALFGGPSSFVPPETPELGPNHVAEKPITAQEVLTLAHHVAGCNYENQTNWGSKMGFRYGSLVEDYFTGYRLQCEGWESVFCHPDTPAFLGDVPISLDDVLNQNKRWSVGLFEVGFSKYSPLTFGFRSMGPIMGLCYAYHAFWAILTIPITIYAFLPQLALLSGVSIFPKVTDPWFFLYVFLFVGAYSQDCLDFILAHGTLERWWNDQRMWLIRGLSSCLFASIEFITKQLGIATQGFNITSKVVDDEQRKRYEQGTFEFGVPSPMFMPLAVAAILNLIAFLRGFIEVFKGRSFDGLLLQVLIAGFVVLNSFPIYQAMVWRTDKGRMPTKTTIIAAFLVWGLYAAVYIYH
ncbi:hypothetical protein RJ639_043775, partial [Escallonia herrerae]